MPTVWGGKESKNVVWKCPLPPTAAKGRADNNQSSPIVWGDAVYVTTVYWPAGKPQSEFPEQHVTCYKLSDGGLQWDNTVPPGPWQLLQAGRSLAASPTVASCSARWVEPPAAFPSGRNGAATLL